MKFKIIKGLKENMTPSELYWQQSKAMEDRAAKKHMKLIENSGIHVEDSLKEIIESMFRQGYYAGGINERDAIVNLYREDAISFDLLAHAIEIDRPKPAEIQ